MRIAGILLIVAGSLFTGWVGYVELFYLSNLESEFEEQKFKSEETNISRIKETEDKFNKMKVKLKNSKVSEKKIEQLDIQLEDLIMGLKANFNKQEKARNDLLESSIRKVRNENFTVELGIAAIILIISGFNIDALPPLSFGYLNIAIVLLVSSTSIFTANLGAKVSVNVNKVTLRRIFSIFLLFTCISLIIEHYII